MRIQNDKVRLEWEMAKAQRNLWIFPILVVIVIMGSLVAVFIPQLRSLFEDRSSLKTASERLERLEAKRATLESVNEPELEVQLQEARRVLPTQKPIYVVVESLAQEFSNLGLVLEGFELSPGKLASDSAVDEEPVERGVLAGVPITFSGRGSMLGVLQFLARVKTMAPLTALSSLEVTGEPKAFIQEMAEIEQFGEVEQLLISGGEEAQEITFTGELRLYYALPRESLGDLAEALKTLTPGQIEVLTGLGEYQSYVSLTASDGVGLDNNRENLFAY